MIPIRIHKFDTVDSTNDIALEMARKGEPEGSVVVAGRQLAGRGRRGRAWQDEPGSCVLMSAIFYPPLSIEQMPRMSMVASLAVAEFLRDRHGVETLVKWPNDVMAHDRKIAGILVETAHAPRGIAAVVGIGVNVRQTAFPEEISGKATSLALERACPDDFGACPDDFGSDCEDVEKLAAGLAEHLFAEYEGYLANGYEETLARWTKYMWGLGRPTQVTSEGRAVIGVIAGVDGTGALLVTDDSGVRHTFIAADEVRQV